MPSPPNKTVLSDTQIKDMLETYEATHSTRKVGEFLGVSHSTASRLLKLHGASILSRAEAMKYVWKNNKHPSIGKRGTLSPHYGKQMPETWREKMEVVWKENGDRKRFGKKITHNGYIHVYMPEHPCAYPDGYVAQHRIVMEKSIGRILNSDEVVHHKNFIKTDNSIENLLLTTKSEHIKIHRKQKEMER